MTNLLWQQRAAPKADKPAAKKAKSTSKAKKSKEIIEEDDEEEDWSVPAAKIFKHTCHRLFFFLLYPLSSGFIGTSFFFAPPRRIFLSTNLVAAPA